MSQESFPTRRFGMPCQALDTHCDPENPVIVSGERILDATHRIKSGIIRTPCNYSKMSKNLNMDLYLKKDYLQVKIVVKLIIELFLLIVTAILSYFSGYRQFQRARSSLCPYKVDKRTAGKGCHNDFSRKSCSSACLSWS